MLILLKQWQQLGLLRPIDFHFAKFIGELGGDNLTILSAALCSEQLGHCHICLPLESITSLFNEKCQAAQLSWSYVSLADSIDGRRDDTDYSP